MTERVSCAITVPMEIEYKPAWMTWVGSVVSCLNALGIECDLADVAGYSGYAFSFSIHDLLCPSGPTVVPIDSFRTGIHFMGRSTMTFHPSDGLGLDTPNDRQREHFRFAYELVKREVEEGRPCVIWGVDVPEYCIAHGVDDGNYLVKSYRPLVGKDETPLAHDSLSAPGGPYVLAFPTVTQPPSPEWPDRHAIAQATILLNRRSHHKRYAFGLDGYDFWIDMMKRGREGILNTEHTPFGNSYNTQCWNEMKWCAKEFLQKCLERNQFLEKPLSKAAKAYGKVYAATHELAQIFPFPDSGQFDEPVIREKAVDLLKDAKSAEKKACKALVKAFETDWPECDQAVD